jgi:hypothetical protein
MAFSSSIIGENTELMPNFRMLVSALGASQRGRSQAIGSVRRRFLTHLFGGAPALVRSMRRPVERRHWT